MRTLTQYKDFFSLLNEDMALSMFRKNLISFNKDGILDKKVAPEELEFTKKNFPEIITAIKSVQSSDKYKKDIGTGDDYLEDKKYLPETLYKKIKSVLTRDSLIKQITADRSGDNEAKNEYVSYAIPNTDIIVFMPFTPEANRFLAHTVLTKPGQPVPAWCIAASSARTMWKRYELEEQEYPPVFIFCRKSGIGDVYDDNKYEVVFTGEYTDLVVNGDASLFVDDRHIEWRHPQQTEHGAYWGYNNRFRKTFPEIAGKKVLDIMVSLMRKYHSTYQKANTRFNKTKRQSDTYSYTGFRNYLDKKAPGIDAKDAVPYAFEYIKNGGSLYVDPDLVFLYNDGYYSPEFADLLYVFVNSPLLKESMEREATIDMLCSEMDDVLRNYPELVAPMFKQLPNLQTIYPENPESYLVAVDTGTLSKQEAIDLFFNKVLVGPDFFNHLYGVWEPEDDSYYWQRNFRKAINKKLPTLLPKLKKEYSASESIVIINELISFYAWFPPTLLSKSQTIQETIDITIKLYYQWVINSEPFTLDEIGLNSYDIKRIDISIIDKFCKIWLRIFAEKPDFIPYNIKFIERIGKIVPSFPTLVNQLPVKVKSKNEVDIIANKLISKFNDGSIKSKDFIWFKKEDRDRYQILVKVLDYLTINKFDFSKINLAIDEFFADITNDAQFVTSFEPNILNFFDLHYEELKYFPVYHGVDRHIRAVICAHILETFVKNAKIDYDWCREFFGAVKADYIKKTLVDALALINWHTNNNDTVLKHIEQIAAQFMTSESLYNSIFAR